MTALGGSARLGSARLGSPRLGSPGHAEHGGAISMVTTPNAPAVPQRRDAALIQAVHMAGVLSARTDCTRGGVFMNTFPINYALPLKTTEDEASGRGVQSRCNEVHLA